MVVFSLGVSQIINHLFETIAHTKLQNYKHVTRQNIVYRLKIIRNYKITKLQDFKKFGKRKNESYVKIIPRSTSEALEFLRQVRFLPDFDPVRVSCAVQ